MSLLEAVLGGDEAEVRRLLSEGGDPNELGDGRRTPLIEAAAAGRADLARLLLDGGAEPWLRDEADETALLKAAALGHRQVCALLFPLAPEEEAELARAFLAAHGKEHGPPSTPPGGLGRKLAYAGAKLSKALGHEEPSKRLERLERAERGDEE